MQTPEDAGSKLQNSLGRARNVGCHEFHSIEFAKRKPCEYRHKYSPSSRGHFREELLVNVGDDAVYRLEKRHKPETDDKLAYHSLDHSIAKPNSVLVEELSVPDSLIHVQEATHFFLEVAGFDIRKK